MLSCSGSTKPLPNIVKDFSYMILYRQMENDRKNRKERRASVEGLTCKKPKLIRQGRFLQN